MRFFARVVAGRRSKWIVIALWAGLLVATAPFAGKLADVRNSQVATADELPDSAESHELAESLRADFESGETFPVVLAYRREGGLTPTDQARIVEEAQKAAEVESALPPLVPFGDQARPEQVSQDRSVAFTVVPLTESNAEKRTEAIEELREDVSGEREGLEARVTGPFALQSDVTTAVEAADAALLIATALLVLVLLVVIYRSPVVPLIPLVVVGISYAIALGLIYLFADATDTTVETTSVAILAVLMFGAGTDYCLLLVAKYTAELQRTEDPHEAMAKAAPHAAPPILASGATVIGALLTLLAADIVSQHNAGPVYAIGVSVVLLAGLTLLPAVLTATGRKAFWPNRERVAFKGIDQPIQPSGVLPVLGAPGGATRGLAATGDLPALILPPGATPDHSSTKERTSFSERVLARPGRAIAFCVTLLLVCSLGLTTYKEDVDQADDFRNTTATTEGIDILEDGFPPGALAPTTVLLRREGGALTPQDVQAMTERLRSIDGVAVVLGPTNQSRDGSAATLSVVFADDPYSDAALDRAELMRERVDDVAPGLSALVGEGTASRLDYGDITHNDLLLVIPLVLLVISVALIVLLRALVAPLYLLATVVLSFFGTFGLSLVIFDVVFGQDSIDPVVALIAFIFLVALGVDYNIFLMSEVREEAHRHGMREGVLRALAATGPVITSAGLVLAGTFAVLMTLPLWLMLEIGFIVALGVLIDTFLVRTVLVPAIALVVGDRSWWPSRVAPRPSAPTAGPLAQGAAVRQSGK